MSARTLRGSTPVIVDTVTLHYFAAVDAVDLLCALCGKSVWVPRAVLDPDEAEDVPAQASSELRRTMQYHRRRANDESLPDSIRARSRQLLPRFEALLDRVHAGALRVVNLSEQELVAYATLRDVDNARGYGLVAPLGRGEAAVLAVAEARGWDIATDDQDAITVAQQLVPHQRPWRIRALLQRAADEGLISLERARELHAAMKEFGFWDKGSI